MKVAVIFDNQHRPESSCPFPRGAQREVWCSVGGDEFGQSRLTGRRGGQADFKFQSIKQTESILLPRHDLGHHGTERWCFQMEIQRFPDACKNAAATGSLRCFARSETRGHPLYNPNSICTILVGHNF